MDSNNYDIYAHDIEKSVFKSYQEILITTSYKVNLGDNCYLSLSYLYHTLDWWVCALGALQLSVLAFPAKLSDDNRAKIFKKKVSITNFRNKIT